MYSLHQRLTAFRCAWRSILLLYLLAGTAYAENETHYQLDVGIEPGTHQLKVSAVVELPPEFAGRTVEFLLTSVLPIDDSDPNVNRLPYEAGGFTGINGSSVELGDLKAIARYRVTLAEGSSTLKLSYSGTVNFPLSSPEEEYARGLTETAGLINSDGVYLAGGTLWYPYFSDELVSFDLTAAVPDDWHLISQGNGSSRDTAGQAHWDSGGLVDEIYLVGGPLTQYEESAGAVAAQVYLREPEAALADKYLSATAQYIEMYRGLIGPYPYGKFALVENFWETGYGMPSFTLLGPQIIRFPFILTSSYPHEILHNWWGNSVFVDYPTGNWCEGLTAYMADHLMKERVDQGVEYRRDTLKKYRDFVRDGRDFPLTEFRSRHSAATEAVGYGKTLMGFHMLRRRLGDEAFTTALARFYRESRGSKASFGDIRAQLEQVSGEDLKLFFQQWVELAGAADLRLDAVEVQTTDDGFEVTGVLRQVQAGTKFELQVPLTLTTIDGLETQLLRVTGAATPFSFETASEPQLLEVDPEFDLFRLLDARETAASIGQVFGDRKLVAVLPAAADEATHTAYRELVERWKSPTQNLTIVLDADIDGLPADAAAWVLGRGNQFAARLFSSDPGLGLTVSAAGLQLQDRAIPATGHSTVVVRRHPTNINKAVGWIAVDPVAAFPGMASKLPHYGKYSYLAFEGDEPTNIASGEWANNDSPLRADLRSAEQRATGPVDSVPRPARKPLAELPAVFSEERLQQHVDYLASPAMQGRGLGSTQLEEAAAYIAGEFASAGLVAAGDDGSYLQGFAVEEGEDGRPHRVHNVIGYLPGTNPAYADQAALITAHYDHLGHGWPDVRQSDAGQIYPGADDNASGVAILIELARNFAAGAPPERNLVFVAFSAEEAGLLGSRYYVEHPRPAPLEGIVGVINLDTVGRLENQPVSVLATGSAMEWPFVFRGVTAVTGIPSENIAGASASSDQQSFIDRGVPGVQIFTGANADYHRASDTPDKINGAGMVKVATFVKEATGYLIQREEPMVLTGSTASGGSGDRSANTEGQRRVSFGTVPDFAHNGDGVRVDSVVPGSPAELAGIQASDVLLEMNGETVTGLGAFSDFLKTLAPGDTVTATVLRDAQTISVAVTVVPR